MKSKTMNKAGQFVVVLLFFMLYQPVWAAKLVVGKTQEFSGTVTKKTWEKTSQSYCQGGSDYYVLTTEDGEYTLNSTRDPIYTKKGKKSGFKKIQDQLEQLVEHTAIVTGQRVSRTFTEKEHCPNPMMQCISGSITCEWIRVQTVEEDTSSKE